VKPDVHLAGEGGQPRRSPDTWPGIEAALRVHAEAALSDHLEIETYIWDVLPDRLKTGDITDYVAHELDG
jgi:hypothetical protein